MARKAPPKPIKLDASMRIVVLHGSERFLIEEHSRKFASMLEEAFGGIEVFTFDGESAEPAAVLDELRSLGLMQQHKLIIVDHADVFLSGKKRGSSDDEEEDDGGSASPRRPLIERYAQNPVNDATLLLRSRLWPKGKLDKLIEKVGFIGQCDSPAPEKAAGWCINRCEKRYDTRIDPAAAELLVARIGPDLLHLDTELMKLAAMVGPGNVITRDAVAESVGLSREEKAWEIQAAILTTDPAIMLRKFHELTEISRQDVVPITWAICDLLRKLHTASQLIRRRIPPQGVKSQAKLWGSTGDVVVQLAGRRPPEVFAQLLQDAIETDRRTKTGFGDPPRSLESLLVKIADKLSPLAA